MKRYIALISLLSIILNSYGQLFNPFQYYDISSTTPDVVLNSLPKYDFNGKKLRISFHPENSGICLMENSLVISNDFGSNDSVVNNGPWSYYFHFGNGDTFLWGPGKEGIHKKYYSPIPFSSLIIYKTHSLDNDIDNKYSVTDTIVWKNVKIEIGDGVFADVPDTPDKKFNAGDMSFVLNQNRNTLTLVDVTKYRYIDETQVYPYSDYVIPSYITDIKTGHKFVVDSLSSSALWNVSEISNSFICPSTFKRFIYHDSGKSHSDFCKYIIFEEGVEEINCEGYLPVFQYCVLPQSLKKFNGFMIDRRETLKYQNPINVVCYSDMIIIPESLEDVTYDDFNMERYPQHTLYVKEHLVNKYEGSIWEKKGWLVKSINLLDNSFLNVFNNRLLAPEIKECNDSLSLITDKSGQNAIVKGRILSKKISYDKLETGETEIDVDVNTNYVECLTRMDHNSTEPYIPSNWTSIRIEMNDGILHLNEYRKQTTGVSSINCRGQKIKAHSKGGELYISNITPGTRISVYSAQGLLLHSSLANSSEKSINVSHHGMVIVKAGDNSEKLIIDSSK